MSWLQQLLVRLELDDHLLHGNDLFHLSVEVFKLDGTVAAYMAPFDAIKLEEQVLCLEGPSNFDIYRARDGVARHVAQHIIVKVDIDRAFKIEIQRLVPKQTRVLVSLTGAAGNFHSGDRIGPRSLRNQC